MAQFKLNHLCRLVIICGVAFSLPAFAGADKAQGVGAHFSAMDTNADGKLSPEEHAAGAKKMFDTMDVNKDGKVTAAEMDAGHEKMAKKKTAKDEMSSSEKIKVVDTNGDRILTAEEHAAGSKSMFGKMDVNKDGFLSKSEVAEGHAKMMHKQSK